MVKNRPDWLHLKKDELAEKKILNSEVVSKYLEKYRKTKQCDYKIIETVTDDIGFIFTMWEKWQHTWTLNVICSV